jgi:hypothetical protein
VGAFITSGDRLTMIDPDKLRQHCRLRLSCAAARIHA